MMATPDLVLSLVVTRAQYSMLINFSQGKRLKPDDVTPAQRASYASLFNRELIHTDQSLTVKGHELLVLCREWGHP